MKIIVIADDLTGAAEVAGAALRFGLTSEVQLGQLVDSDADVVVVDADSRSSNAETAFAKVHELTKQAVAMRPDVLFKKVDSLLRGPVLAEVTAMRIAGDFDRCLLLCGNPRKGRTVIGGKVYVDGVPLHETGFAVDPEHPCSTNDVVQLLTQHGMEIGSASSQTDSLHVIDPGDEPVAFVSIGNLATPKDLEPHTRLWFSWRETTLAAGGAEFFEAVLRMWVGSEPAEPESEFQPETGDTLLISGSHLSRSEDWPLLRFEPHQSSEECAMDVCKTLSTRGRAAIRAVDFLSGSPSQRIEQISEIAGRVLATCRPTQVWIEGGRTASTLIRDLGYQRLIAIANVGDGVVALRSIDETSPLYLIKPGSYPWPTQSVEEASVATTENNAVASRLNGASSTLMSMLLVWFVLLTPSSEAVAAAPNFEAVAEILTEQCLDCHNTDTKEGTVDLERFQSLSDVDADRSLWKTVFDVVEAGQMPLQDSGYELDESQRDVLLQFIRQALSAPDPKLQAIDPGKPILRRLTRLEYNNTVRDLFGLNYDIFMFPERLPVADKRYFTGSQNGLGNVVQTSMREYGQKYDVLLPQLGLPGDSRAEHGFANRGDSLNFSPLLFEKYLEVAAAIATSDRLLRDSRVMQELLAAEPPTPRVVKTSSATVKLSSKYAARESIGEQAAANDFVHDGFVSALTSAFERGSGGTFDIPSSLNNETVAGKGGLLKLRLQDNVMTINPNVDLWLASFGTANETSGEHLLTNKIKDEKVFELTFAGAGNFNPEIEHLGVCVLARRNQSGPVRLTVVLSDGQKIQRQAEISEATGNVFFSWAAPTDTSIKKLAVDGSQFSGDYVLLDDLGFVLKQRGNIVRVEKESRDKKIVAAAPPTQLTQPLRDRVAKFLLRAYRRDVTPQELESAMTLIAERTASGDTETEALRRWLQSVLSSPEFLFLAEPVMVAPASTEPTSKDTSTVRPLEPYELANRLSYFLWASMPDDELLELAESKAILRPDVLRTQVQRMLADRTRSRELSESFAAQWLRLDQLYSSKPDRKLFKRFYSGPQGKSTLHGPMMTEALLLFETVLADDRSVLDLYDAEFTWLNSQLAELYGLESSFNASLADAIEAGDISETSPDKVSSKVWVRTPLPDRTRGGVLTMAGPLMLTSLPFRTSPIKRGAWLLETVFNRPPSEPKVAFVLEEATKESTDDSPGQATQTVRQLFEKHRNDPNCNSCHSRIDPPGFSLEVFDAMGAYRTHDGAQKVDASGTWNNQDFTTPTEFKDAIAVQQQELVRGLAEHLLSYAVGRKLEHFDMQTVDKIVSDAGQDGYRMSAIIDGIVLSYPFRHVRNQP